MEIVGEAAPAERAVLTLRYDFFAAQGGRFFERERSASGQGFVLRYDLLLLRRKSRQNGGLADG
ncbi:MAG: hypothetical protein RR540_03945 [Oscillospiraceae bacterium]